MSADAYEVRTKIVAAVRRLMAALIERNGEVLEDVFTRSRCEREDVYRVMDEYDVGFAMPSQNAYEYLEIAGKYSHFAVDADFWDNEGKRRI